MNKTRMVNIGVIGCGYWGPNLLRNFHGLAGANISCVCDLNPERLKFTKSKYPHTKTTRQARDIFKDKSIDAVAITTPATSHFALVQEALRHNKHVLVEKPLAANTKQAKKLCELSQKRKKVLMVDHTFIYTGAVRKIKEIIDKGELGKIFYFDSVRMNLGLFRHDVNVVWDLAPHDLAIIDYLIDKKPVEVSALGIDHLKNGLENIAYIFIRFRGNLCAHLHVNCLTPVKIKMILIGGNKKMLLYDDMQASEKVKVYDRGIKVIKSTEDIHKALMQYRIGDMHAPKIDQTEALHIECGHFLDCIRNKKNPITDGEAGLRVVSILEAVQKSIKNKGKTIKL